MRKITKISTAIVLVLVMLLCAGCAKENKYVNVGVGMSTAGLSLYLTNTAAGLEKISTYVFFAGEGDTDETFEKISKDKQGIDITYISADKLSRIKEDSNYRVVFIDCFETNGDLKGVWIARDGWLTDAPNYSAKYLRGLVKSVDYRASHMGMTYDEALDSIKGMRDFDFTVQNDTLQFVAVFDASNDDVIAHEEFTVRSASELKTMFADFDKGSGEGYNICKAAYDKYCTAAGTMSFEDMFSLELMNKAIIDVEKEQNE